MIIRNWMTPYISLWSLERNSLVLDFELSLCLILILWWCEFQTDEIRIKRSIFYLTIQFYVKSPIFYAKSGFFFFILSIFIQKLILFYGRKRLNLLVIKQELELGEWHRHRGTICTKRLASFFLCIYLRVEQSKACKR